MAGRHAFHRVRISAFHPTVPRLVHCLVVHLALIILFRPEIGSQQQLIQDGVDKRPHRPYRRPLTSTPLARWRLGTRQRLTHHPPVHPQLAGYP